MLRILIFLCVKPPFLSLVAGQSLGSKAHSNPTQRDAYYGEYKMLLNSVKGANCACIAERQMNQTLASQFHLGHDSVLGTILPIEWLPQQSRIVLGNYPLSYLNCILMAPLQTCLVTLFDCFFGCDSSICVIRKIYSDIKRCNIYIRTLQVRCIPCT